MPRVWFVRSNGETAHADPTDPGLYVPGEPPGEFDYRERCLELGFARIGWPNTGDLRAWGRGRLAPGEYDLPSYVRRYLDQFAGICNGDLILIPAGAAKGDVHVGIVTNHNEVSAAPGIPAYYYHHDVPNGAPYECAHLVDVRWLREPGGEAIVRRVDRLGGLWLRAFGPVHAAAEQVMRLAAELDSNARGR